MRNSSSNILFVLFVFLLPLLVACESREEEGRDFSTAYPVACHVSPRSISDPNTATVSEQINTLLLFMVNTNNNTIEAIIKQDFTEAPTGEYTGTVQLTAGTKKVYGFSNLTTEILDKTGLSNLETGDRMPDLTAATCSPLTDELISGKNGCIPMSNVVDIIVTKVAGQTFEIELIRLLCKIKLNFKNETGNAIQLKKMTIHSVTADLVYLLPTVDNANRPVLPVGATKASQTYIFPDGAMAGDEGDYTFYLNESVDTDNQNFTLTLNTQREGIAQETRMSLTELSHLNRNTYLPLNIILTDYKFKLDLTAYPPIGGYPSVYEGTDGFYCSCPGGGPFEITPVLSHFSGAPVMEEEVVWGAFTCDDPDGIFETTPALNNVGEITGVLRNTAMKQGRAKCSVTATVKTAGGVSRTLIYNMYIQNY